MRPSSLFRPRSSRKAKVFGVGTIKTGTTSLGTALAALGYRHTHDRRDELLRSLQQGNLKPILRHARAHDSFEDWPWPLVYREMADHFPDARFVLTRRATEEKWLASISRWSDRVGPTLGREMFFGFPVVDGNEDAYAEAYRRHLDDVRARFRDEPHRLLEVCWENGDGWDALCSFLREPVPTVPFPHENPGDAPIAK